MGMESRGRRRLRRTALIATMLGALAPAAADAATLSVTSVNESAGSATVTIERSTLEALSSETFTLATQAGTATAGTDYTPAPSPGQITLGVLDTSGTASIPILDDPSDENNETFTVTASGISGAVTSTIGDDDDPPVLAIRDASETEGTGSDTKALPFTVEVGVPSGKPISVAWTTTQDLGSTPAELGADLAGQSGTLTIPAGSKSATVPVAVIQDNVDEPDEQFGVELRTPVSNAQLTGGAARSTAVGTIVNDDVPLVTIENVVGAEGHAGQSVFGFPVRISNPSKKRISVDFATSDFPGANPAAAGSDYAQTSGTLVWEPGETDPKVVGVAVLGDTSPEQDEVFVVSLGNAVGAATLPAALGGILNDDGGTVTGKEVGAGTGSGFTGTSGTGATIKPKLGTLRSRKAGQVSVKVDCPASATVCKGQMSVLSVVQRKSKIKALRRETTIGTLNVDLKGGTSRTYTLKLSKKLKRTFKKVKKVKVAAYAVLRDQTGTAAAVQSRGTLTVRK